MSYQASPINWAARNCKPDWKVILSLFAAQLVPEVKCEASKTLIGDEIKSAK